MKTPEEYYNSLDAIDSLIDKYKEFNFSSFDMVKFTKAYVKDVVLPEMRKQEKEQDELILELFMQGCTMDTDFEGRKYDHLYIGAYEDAQEYLLKKGIIKPENCYRI